MHRQQKLRFFEIRGGLLNNEVFTNTGRLEVVYDFNYLETVFNYTGIFSIYQQQLIGKGLKALNILLINCRKYKLKRKLLCK